MKKKSLLMATVLAFNPAMEVLAEEKERQDETLNISPVVVKGILPDRLESVPGSYFLVDEKALQERQPFSVQEALNNVPGINVVGENAFGLGVNIGVRGLDPRRTSRTLLMEDGMPLFLAPYADPAAHYTTPLERVQRIEVVKGSGQILYGPQTVGGMINFVTRPVPSDGQVHGTASAMMGNNDFTSLYGSIGAGDERGGLMIDALHKKGDGIRDHHDFEIQEYTAKGQLNLSDRHTLIAKASYFREDSHVTETGLSAAEYAQNKYQAPTGHNDKFEQERKTLQLQHVFSINDAVKLTTQAYYVDTNRASFRQINNPGENNGFSRLSNCPNNGLRNNLGNADQCGGRWRPRDFQYWGIEPRLDVKHSLFGMDSNAVIGFRYHEEDSDRKQYRVNDPAGQSLSFAKSAVLPHEDIRINVEARSYYAQNTFFVGDWTFTPGVRVEDIRVKTDVLRADGAVQNNPQATLNNHQTKVLPGFGVTWGGIDNTSVFAGVHKGFAPPRPDRDLDADGPNSAVISKTKPEESTNWELGVRSTYFKGVRFEATLFHTVFDEIVVAGPTSGSFVNGGESQQTGLELAGRIDFGTLFATSHNIYIAGSYTNLFTAKFKKTNASADIFKGDRLPYAPKHLASLNLGYQHPVGFDARIGVDYVSEQQEDVSYREGRPEALDYDGTGLSGRVIGVTGKIPSYALINATVNYRPVGSHITYFASAYNLGDREYLASRVDGMVAGRQRQVFAGIRYDF